MHRTNTTRLGVAAMFPSFRLNFASEFVNLPLVRFHQAEIIYREASYPRTQQQGLGGS